MPLGLAFGMFVVFVSVAGFIQYAVRTPGLQTLAFMWGLANGIALYAILPKIPVIGPWLAGGVEYLINPPIPKPDWLTEDMIALIWPAIVALAIYLYVTRVMGVRPRLQSTVSPNAGARGSRPRPAVGRRTRPVGRPVPAETAAEI